MRVRLLLAVLFLAVPLQAATRIWSGQCFPHVWSNGACWSGGVAPSPGDALSFAGTFGTTNTNDYPPGTPFGPIDFPTHGFRLTGNLIVLNGGIVDAFSGSYHQYNLDFPIRLGGSQAWSLTFDSHLFVSGGLDLNGATLDLGGGLASVTIDSAISGSGSIVTATDVDLRVATATSPMTGTLASAAFRNVTVDAATIPGANILANTASAFLVNNATVGNVNVSAGALLNGFPLQNHTANTKNVTLTNGSGVDAYLDSTAPGGAFHLNVQGTVSISNTVLRVHSASSFPPGTTFTLFDNDGSDPVSGTFANLPEGGKVLDDVSKQVFEISYAGGSGNDIVLTATSDVRVPTLGEWALVALALALAGVALFRLR